MCIFLTECPISQELLCYPCTVTTIGQVKMTSVPAWLMAIKVETFLWDWRTHIMRMNVIRAVRYIPENSNLLLYADFKIYGSNNYISCRGNTTILFCSTLSLTLWVRRICLRIMKPFCTLVKVKGKSFPCLCREGIQGAQRYSSTICNQGSVWR